MVLLERPIIAIADDGRGDEWKLELQRQYESLPNEQRKEVWELHDACLQMPEKCLALTHVA